MQTISDIIKAGAPMTLEQIIKQEIDDWRRSPELKLMKLGQQYYGGDHEVLKRRREVIGEGGRKVEDKNLANRRLVHMFIRKLVDQKIGYLLSKQPSIQTNNEAYASELSDIFGKAFLRLLKNIGKDAINNGIGWLHVYYNDTGELAFKRISPDEVIPLWKDSAHTELDGVIRTYELDYYEGMNKRAITKVEYWDNTGVRRYTLDAIGSVGLKSDEEAGAFGSHFSAMEGEGKETPLNWEQVPFIPFKYNDDELPLIKVLQSLVDDYDEQRSDNSNNIADLPNGIYVLKDYDGTDLGEFRHNLSRYRAVKVQGDGDVNTLTLDLNPEALKQHVEQLRKDIYEFGRGVDTQSDKFGSSPSGIALRFLYADLDLDANDIENEFQAGLEQLLWFVDKHIANTIGTDYSDVSVDFIFNRDMMINETEAVNNVKSSVGIISDETLIANHPFVTDPADELARMEKQKALEPAPYSGLNPDNSPNGAGG
ncbi:phage portal protein [Paenibacillus baekrokdamisoli]|nr:phage portal protein [Paenibacillus baekrokdamisoli]